MSDYKVTAEQLASIANAIRLKGGTSAVLEYPNEWLSVLANLVPASGGSEITPQNPTAEYRVTDTELTAIANVIRTKCGISSLLEFPSGYVSAIQSISGGGGSGVDIVPWATGTDAQIAAMVAALDSGDITIADTGWSIGDERTVSLSAMSGNYVYDSHSAQNATFVILDSQHFDLVGGGKDHFVVGMKDCLNTKGAINKTRTNTGSWDGSNRRSWCNNTFRNAIPSELRNCFKLFKTITADSYNGSTNKISEDYFALPAEKEVQGAISKSNDSENVLTQLAYYANSNNRIKKVNGTYGYWFVRSPVKDNNQGWCYTRIDGPAGWGYANSVNGIAPFGCI